MPKQKKSSRADTLVLGERFTNAGVVFRKNVMCECRRWLARMHDNSTWTCAAPPGQQMHFYSDDEVNRKEQELMSIAEPENARTVHLDDDDDLDETPITMYCPWCNSVVSDDNFVKQEERCPEEGCGERLTDVQAGQAAAVFSNENPEILLTGNGYNPLTDEFSLDHCGIPWWCNQINQDNLLIENDELNDTSVHDHIDFPKQLIHLAARRAWEEF